MTDTVAVIFETLAQHRPEILRAELAGWLHVGARLIPNWRANDNPFLFRFQRPSESLKARAAAIPKAQKRMVILEEDLRPFSLAVERAFASLDLKFPNEQWTMGELLMLWNRCHMEKADDCRALGVFNASHARASQMKLPGIKLPEGQNANQSLVSVFGHEQSVKYPEELDDLLLQGLGYGQNPTTNERDTFSRLWQEAGHRCYAHDKKPVNDITVWDYAQAVAAFFKAAVAKVWIENQLPEHKDGLQWKLAGIGYPGLEFVASAVRISDALARRKWVDGKLNRLRQLMEFEYPLGNEIYRDENGAVYLVADFKELSSTLDGIVEKIEDRDDDFLPHVSIHFEVSVLDRQGRPQKLLPIGQAVKELAVPRAVDYERVARWWIISEPAVICPVCQLRPKAAKGQAEQRYVCEQCFDRRQDLQRSRRNLASLPTSSSAGNSLPSTIWIDEAADDHGICALITGRLNLEPWLTEDQATSPFRFLTVNAAGDAIKSAEFLRVQACWATAERFWRDLEATSLSAPGLSSRYRLVGHCRAGQPLHSHVYEAEIGQGSLSAVWDDEAEAFVTASNLRYLLAQVVGEKKHFSGVEIQNALRRSFLFRLPRGYLNVEDAGHYQERDDAREDDVWFHVDRVEPCTQYRPVIPILATPQHYLAVVPAAEAPGECLRIIGQYQEQFGKVSTMLPMTLGMILFDRRTPIYAVLQTGQKMLRLPGVRGPGIVRSPREIEVCLGVRKRRIGLWDGQDQFFARLETGDHVSRAVDELPADASVFASVSRVDFLHLEATGQRYRLAYDTFGFRLDPKRSTRALTLDEFLDMEDCWKHLANGLTTSQINELFAAAEQKREEWGLAYPVDDPTFLAFVRALVRQAEWRPPLPSDGANRIAAAVASGLFRDAIELHMKVLKQKGR